MILYFFHSGDVMRHSTLYHLLKGKKTTSVLSYGRLHGILNYFNLFPKLTKEQYNAYILMLITNDYLEEVEDQLVILTAKGKEKITTLEFSRLTLQSFDYDKVDDAFWLRLLFISQVISYKSHRNSDYIPIDNNPVHQLQLKQWLVQVDGPHLVHDFFNEWQTVLSYLPIEEQEILVSQLVGDGVIGYTISQLSQQSDKGLLYYYLHHKSAIHLLLELVYQEPDQYPLFLSIIKDIKKQEEQDTVDLTRRLLEKGYSIEEVAYMRRLKPSTITDHFIEIHIKQPSSQLMTYLTPSLKEKLNNYSLKYPEYKMWKYSVVVRDIPELTFYEFKFYQFYLRDNMR